MESSSWFLSFPEENKPPNKSQSGMETLFGSTSTNNFVDKMVNSDAKELQISSQGGTMTFLGSSSTHAVVDEKPDPKDSSSPNEDFPSGILQASDHVNLHGQWNKSPSKILLVDAASFGDDEMIPHHEFLKIKKAAASKLPRYQGGLSALFSGSPTNPVVDVKVESDLEELQEEEIWACIEASPTKAAPDGTFSVVHNDTSGIFQPSAKIDIPGRWNKIPSTVDVAGLEDGEWIPPHEFLKKKRAAYTGLPWSFSVCQGIGRTLKGRDALEFRDAVLRMTGFIEN